MFLTSTATNSLYGRKPSPVLSLIFLMLSSNLLRISAHLFGAPLPCPSPCPLPGVFSLCPMDHLTVRTLWYFSRYFSHFSLPRNVLHCEGIEPHTFCFLSLIFRLCGLCNCTVAFPYVTPHCRQSVASSSKSPDFIELDLGVYFGPVNFTRLHRARLRPLESL